MLKAKRRQFLIILILSLLLLIGCDNNQEEEVLVATLPLRIIGDINNSLSIKELDGTIELLELTKGNEKIAAIAFSELILKAQPWTDIFKVFLQDFDGFVTKMTPAEIAASYFMINKERNWQLIDSDAVNQIKNIQNIVVIANNLPLGTGFNIIDTQQNIAQLSIGQIYKDGYNVFLAPRSDVVQDQAHTAKENASFQQYKELVLSNYFDLNSIESGLVIGSKGEVVVFDKNGRLIVQENSLGYMLEGQLIIDEARGIVVNPPTKMITDVFYDTQRLLEQGHQVLLILVDGLGYHQFEFAKANNNLSFLTELPAPEKAMVAYPPVTPVNVAASLTGTWPFENEVYRRGIRRAEKPTIFAYTEEVGKSSKAIIGPLSTIEFEINPLFTIGTDDEGRNDHLKTERALIEMANGYDLIFVHLKDLDRAGHNYGALADKTIAELQNTDGYLQQLLQAWDGSVIIYSDHGMHNTAEGGDHRHLIFQDMFVPYWILKEETISE